MMFLKEEAKERQATSTGGTSPQLVVNLPEAEDRGRSREKAAELVGVSPSLIQHAKKGKNSSKLYQTKILQYISHRRDFKKLLEVQQWQKNARENVIQAK